MTDSVVASSPEERPTASRGERLVGVAHVAILALSVVALVTRSNGALWAEVLAAGGVLASVYGLSSLRGPAELLKIDVWFAALFLIWMGVFAYEILATPNPPETVAPALPPAPMPARKVLHAYGPLSVVVDDDWFRVVEPPSDPDVLFVTDGVALSFSAEPFALDDDAADLVDETDTMASAIAEEEGFRTLESWNGSVDGAPTAERVLVQGDGEAYCLLLMIDRDGYRIVARGDSFAEFGDRDVVGELRRVAASLRATGNRRGAEPAVPSTSTEETTP